MRRFAGAGPEAPDEGDALVDVLSEGAAILEEERDIFLAGAFERIAAITARKHAIVDRLEAAIRTAPRTDAAIAGLRRLIALSRRNEQIIEAARQGLAHARRRIASIVETRRGAVAYAEDGSRIACSADLGATEQMA